MALKWSALPAMTQGEYASVADVNCLDCHGADDPDFMQQHLMIIVASCQSCHDGVDRMSGFDHAQVFPLDGRHARSTVRHVMPTGFLREHPPAASSAMQSRRRMPVCLGWNAKPAIRPQPGHRQRCWSTAFHCRHGLGKRGAGDGMCHLPCDELRRIYLLWLPRTPAGRNGAQTQRGRHLRGGAAGVCGMPSWWAGG